ncbi:YtxH domain-containing protein [Candidatus Peregrinibacteria bacterium]|nr:YtxH domain-containing protein [Candidatus Peregrinibacteria bacterium]MBT7484039.1 YtxH domain-containing protein [Candidatus Peregrinibacteria bacterium]MBT7703502.1 YtxH domain-containing protein [Candidatus Peregrinibacteria bacterium]
MFGRKKKEQKKRSTIDKVVMGAIIGTAVGSVIGLTVAPKKGKDTRRFLRKKMETSNTFVDEDVKEIGKLTKETATGLLKIGKRLLGVERKQKGLKEIPREEVATQQQITPSAGKPNEKETHWAIPDQEK